MAVSPSGLKDVTLTRMDTGLGFNIRGGKDHPFHKFDNGIFVTKIHPNGAAYADERLKEGDKIVEVNGKSLLELTHYEAVDIIKSAGLLVKMKVLPKERVQSKAPLTQAPAQTIKQATVQEMKTLSGKQQATKRVADRTPGFSTTESRPGSVPANTRPRSRSSSRSRSRPNSRVSSATPEPKLCREKSIVQEAESGVGLLLPGLLGLVAAGLLGALVIRKYATTV